MRYANPLANAIMVFIASLLAAALIIAALNSPFGTIMGVSESVVTTPEGQAGTGFISTAWDLLPFIVVVLGLIQLIGAAAVEASV